MKIHCKYDALLSPKELKLHPKNRNKHPKEQIDRLEKIINYQGWRHAIKVSNQSGFVTTGNGRVMMALAKKMKEIPVVYQDYENSDQEYADVQADNAIAYWAELDFASINLDVPDLGPDFDMDWLGFKQFFVDRSDKDDFLREEDEKADLKGIKQVILHYDERDWPEFTRLIKHYAEAHQMSSISETVLNLLRTHHDHP